jgi:riboflavin kinase/FMN adenylyltransferase
VVRTHGLGSSPVDGVASLGVRPTVEDAGRVLLEVHCLTWPAAQSQLAQSEAGLDSAYGKIVRVELLAKLHDELKYEGLDALKIGIAKDCDDARAFFAALSAPHSLQSLRERI